MFSISINLGRHYFTVVLGSDRGAEVEEAEEDEDPEPGPGSREGRGRERVAGVLPRFCPLTFDVLAYDLEE